MASIGLAFEGKVVGGEDIWSLGKMHGLCMKGMQSSGKLLGGKGPSVSSACPSVVPATGATTANRLGRLEGRSLLGGRGLGGISTSKRTPSGSVSHNNVVCKSLRDGVSWPGPYPESHLGNVTFMVDGVQRPHCSFLGKCVVGGKQRGGGGRAPLWIDVSGMQGDGVGRGCHMSSRARVSAEMNVGEFKGRTGEGLRASEEGEVDNAVVKSREIRDAKLKYLRGGMSPKCRKEVEAVGVVEEGNVKVWQALGHKGGSGKTVEFLETYQTRPAHYIVEEAAVRTRRTPPNISLSEFLSIMRRTLGLPMYSTDLCFTVRGRELMFDLDADWSLAWCTDGRFREVFDSPELQFDWGLDSQGNAWDADASGHISRLDLDDHDLAVLTAWIRSGYWLTAAARSRLQIEFLSDEEKSKLKDDFNATIDDYKCISVCVPGRNVKAVVVVDKITYLPICMRLNVFGTHEVWTFENWTQIVERCPFKFPLRTLRQPTSGGAATYIAESLECVSMAVVDGNQHRHFKSDFFDPPRHTVPRHNPRYPSRSFNPDLPCKLKMTLTESRHNVIRPLVNGQDVGYFMIDTGASGITISPDVADALNMTAFGRLHVTGVQGSMDTQYRVGETFELGPLKITNPIFMEIPNHNCIRGPSVVGICGYDIFRDCIVEMVQKDGTIAFYDRDEFANQNRGDIPWQELYLIGNVPHAKVSVDGLEELFLIDTGAGGTDLIFHFRAVEKHNLMESYKCTSGTSLRGMGQDTDSLSVVSAKMKNFKVGKNVVKEVSALFSLNKTGGVDLSEYTAGILCGDLLMQFRILYDYKGRRVAFIPERKRKGKAWRIMAAWAKGLGG